MSFKGNNARQNRGFTMLILTRRKHEKIIIGNLIEITVLEISGKQIKIGIEAPRDIPIDREEVSLVKRKKSQTTSGTLLETE